MGAFDDLIPGGTARNDGIVQIAPADPRLSGQMQSTNLGNQRTQQQMATDAAIAPWALRQAKASALAAEVGLQDKLKPKIDPATAGRLANLKALEKQMGRIRELYRQGPGATKGVSGLGDFLPTEVNSKFDSAGAGITQLAQAAFRVPGTGEQSDRELQTFVAANQPSSWDKDGAIEEKMRNLRTRLTETYKAMGMQPPAAPWQNKPVQRSTQQRRAPAKVIDFNDLPE